MKYLKLIIALLLLAIPAKAVTWYIISDTGLTNLTGIVDTNGNYHGTGILAMDYRNSGYVPTYFPNGICWDGIFEGVGIVTHPWGDWSYTNLEYHLCGLLGDVNDWAYTGIVKDGVYEESGGIIDSSGRYHYCGVLGNDGNGGYLLLYSGIVDINGDLWDWGMYDGYTRTETGIMHDYGAISTSGILAPDGTYHGSGIVLGDGSYFDGQAIDCILSQYGPSIVDASGVHYSGILNGAGYNSDGILTRGGSYYSYGVYVPGSPTDDGFGGDAGYFDCGIVDRFYGYHIFGILADADGNGYLYTHYNISNAFHTITGGQVSASTIGSFAGTTNLIPEYLKAGTVVDDVTGTLTGGASLPGFGGGVFTQ